MTFSAAAAFSSVPRHQDDLTLFRSDLREAQRVQLAFPIVHDGLPEKR